MKDKEFTECPLCGGKLEHHTVLQHPQKGIIHNIPHDVCTHCGEIFLGDESFDIVHSHGRKEKAAAYNVSTLVFSKTGTDSHNPFPKHLPDGLSNFYATKTKV